MRKGMGMTIWGVVILYGSVRCQGPPGDPTPIPPSTPATAATGIPLPDRCAFALPRNKDEFVSALNSKISVTERRYWFSGVSPATAGRYSWGHSPAFPQFPSQPNHSHNGSIKLLKRYTNSFLQVWCKEKYCEILWLKRKTTLILKK